MQPPQRKSPVTARKRVRIDDDRAGMPVYRSASRGGAGWARREPPIAGRDAGSKPARGSRDAVWPKGRGRHGEARWKRIRRASPGRVVGRCSWRGISADDFGRCCRDDCRHPEPCVSAVRAPAWSAQASARRGREPPDSRLCGKRLPRDAVRCAGVPSDVAWIVRYVGTDASPTRASADQFRELVRPLSDAAQQLAAAAPYSEIEAIGLPVTVAVPGTCFVGGSPGAARRAGSIGEKLVHETSPVWWEDSGPCAPDTRTGEPGWACPR